MRTIVWFRGKDLRLADHRPLHDAISHGEVIPLFVLDPYFFAPSRAAELPHRIQFLLDSLRVLDDHLRRCGSRLLVVPGKSVEVVPRLCALWQADRIVAQSWVEPFAQERDRRISAALGEQFVLFHGETLAPVGGLRTASGQPYSVFSPYARAFGKTHRIETSLPAPAHLPPLPELLLEQCVDIPSCADLGLTRNPALQVGGEEMANQRLQRFLQSTLADYSQTRNLLDVNGSSRLSADLKFGTLSVRELWNHVVAADVSDEAKQSYCNELLWREFCHQLLASRPSLLEQPFRPGFADFPWRDDELRWKKWADGQTGYPIVDAAAQQLLREGFVHNRARMISASFLTKHLLVHYRYGEAHFLKHLTDGDWAQNNAGWQWSAGCGCDAQPYFRIFNPVTQGEKFDPSGEYVRKWVPQLAALPNRYIHQPWTAPASVLAQAGVKIGGNYPPPIVDHQTARQQFLTLSTRHLQQRA